MFCSEATVGYIVVIFVSVWTIIPTEGTVEKNEPFSTAEQSERVENFLFRSTRKSTGRPCIRCFTLLRRALFPWSIVYLYLPIGTVVFGEVRITLTAKMVVIFVSVWTVLPSEANVVIFMSVWTVLSSEGTVEQMVLFSCQFGQCSPPKPLLKVFCICYDFKQCF